MMAGRRRARLLHEVAQRIRADREALARLEVMESGKPIAQARSEMAAAVDLWEYASTLCRHTRGDTYNTLGESKLGMVLREPAGVVGMITPWNFPLLIISQKLPFALAAGCTAVIKPSATRRQHFRLDKVASRPIARKPAFRAVVGPCR